MVYYEKDKFHFAVPHLCRPWAAGGIRLDVQKNAGGGGLVVVYTYYLASFVVYNI
jgi:hypothetical protein